MNTRNARSTAYDFIYRKCEYFQPLPRQSSFLNYRLFFTGKVTLQFPSYALWQVAKYPHTE